MEVIQGFESGKDGGVCDSEDSFIGLDAYSSVFLSWLSRSNTGGPSDPESPFSPRDP